MSSKTTWFRGAMALGLGIAVMVTSSVAGLAASVDKRLMGELTVVGTTIYGEPAFVMLNGDRAYTGRTVLSASTVKTTDDAGATVNLGALGRVELSPNTSLSLMFNESSITGVLNGGDVVVVNAPNVTVKIQTANGIIENDKTGSNIVAVNANAVVAEANAVAGVSSARQSDDSNIGTILAVAGAIGGAAAVIIYATTGGGDDDDSNNISPIR